MFSIKKIAIKDLASFVKSTLFLNFKNKPISLLRATSYINNPNAKLEDICLYLTLDNNKLIAFRTVFAGSFIYEDTEEQFCWLSGSWTHKDYRRKGLSIKLFNEIYNDWQGRIIFANYAPNSKALYDKTNVFTLLQTLKGKRYYRRICLTELLAHKNTFFKTIKPILKLTDFTANLFLDVRFSKNNKLSNYQIEKLSNWHEEEAEFLDTFKANELFKRTPKTYSWIKNNPWIKTDLETKQFSENYNFSTFSKIFENDFYCITDKQTLKIIALVQISIRDKHLKIPYLYTEPKNLKTVKSFVINLSKEYKINYLTIFDDNLNTILSKKERFLKSRNFEQGFFISKTLLEKFPKIKNRLIKTGDGDGVFT